MDHNQKQWHKIFNNPDFQCGLRIRFQVEYGISHAEFEVIFQSLSGKSRREVGKALLISEATVKFHITQIKKKLKMHRNRRMYHLYSYVPIDLIMKFYKQVELKMEGRYGAA